MSSSSSLSSNFLDVPLRNGGVKRAPSMRSSTGSGNNVTQQSHNNYVAHILVTELFSRRKWRLVAVSTTRCPVFYLYLASYKSENCPIAKNWQSLPDAKIANTVEMSQNCKSLPNMVTLVVAQWSNKFGYDPSWTVFNIMQFFKHNSLPLGPMQAFISFYLKATVCGRLGSLHLT